MFEIFEYLIYVTLGAFALLQFIVFVQDIITSAKREKHGRNVESTNLVLSNNRPEARDIQKFEHWKKYIEPKYVNWGQEHPGLLIPYYSTVKYPPDWNMRRLYIAELYENKCAICSKYDKLGHTHHVNPLSRGGDNSIENLVYLCRYCHEDQHWHMKLSKDRRRKEIAKLNITEEEYLQRKRAKYFELRERN